MAGCRTLGKGTSKMIGSEHTTESIAAAVARWDSQSLEDALAGPACAA